MEEAQTCVLCFMFHVRSVAECRNQHKVDVRLVSCRSRNDLFVDHKIQISTTKQSVRWDLLKPKATLRERASLLHTSSGRRTNAPFASICSLVCPGSSVSGRRAFRRTGVCMPSLSCFLLSGPLWPRCFGETAQSATQLTYHPSIPHANTNTTQHQQSWRKRRGESRGSLP